MNKIKEYHQINDGEAYSRIKSAFGKPLEIKKLHGSTSLITYSIEKGVFFQFFKFNNSIISPRLMGGGEKLKKAEINLRKRGLELRIKTEKLD